MRGISIKAILLATFAVMGIDLLLDALLIHWFDGPSLQAPAEQFRAGMDALLGNAGYLAALLVLGTASTVVGGYLTARLSHSVPYFNALAFGTFNLLLGMLMSAGMPMWVRIVGLGLTIPAALLGAYLSAARRR